MNTTIYGVILAITLTPAWASAAILYSFGAGGNASSSHAMSVDGLNLEISGFSDDYDPITNTGTAARINRHARGWGIHFGPADHRIGLGEAMVFDWASSQVRLLSGIFFERGSAPIEMFDLYIDGSLILDDFRVLPDDPRSNLVSLDFSGLDLVGSIFAIVGQTPQQGHDNNQGFRIQQLVVAPIPEPSSLIITALGLAGISLGRRRGVTKTVLSTELGKTESVCSIKGSGGLAFTSAAT